MNKKLLIEGMSCNAFHTIKIQQIYIPQGGML